MPPSPALLYRSRARDRPDIGLCRVGAGQAYVLRFEDRSIKCGVVCSVSIWPNDGPLAARLVLVSGRASSAAEPLNRRGGSVRYGTGCVVSGGSMHRGAPRRAASQDRLCRTISPRRQAVVGRKVMCRMDLPNRPDPASSRATGSDCPAGVARDAFRAPRFAALTGEWTATRAEPLTAGGPRYGQQKTGRLAPSRSRLDLSA